MVIKCVMARIIPLLLLSCWVLFNSALAQPSPLFPIEKSGKAGYIDRDGKIIIPLKFDEARNFADGVASVRVGDDWGYIDGTGKFVISPQFFQAGSFNDGIASVGVWFPRKKVVDNKVGFYSYIDKTGKLITKKQYGVAFAFSEGVAQVLTDDYKHGIIDRTGEILFYFDIYNAGFRNGLAMFKTNGNMPDTRIGYIDKTGKAVIAASYLAGQDFSEGLACVSSEKGAGFIDNKGTTAVDFHYNACGSFSDGLASVLVGGLVGFIDRTGKVVVQPNFNWVPGDETRFSDGVAVVQVGASEQPTAVGVRDVRIDAARNMYAVNSGLFGVIDKSGKFIIPPKYVQIGDFHNGLAWVNLSDSYIIHGDTDRWGYLNKKDEIVWKSF